MKKLPLIALLPALFVMTLPSIAQGKAGQLDKSFGRAGKVATLLGPRPANVVASPLWFAWAGRGRIVVALDQTLLEYLPNGHLNRGFGANGKVAIRAPAGRALETSGMTVDSRGRILVAGTTRPDQSSASVFVARYLPGGRLDPSFGDGGTVVTDLGLPAPTVPPKPELLPQPTITGAIVEASGLAVDAADRPLLTGSWIGEYQLCYPSISFSQKGTAYVARLAADGSIDRSFGAEGIATNPSLSQEREFSPLVDGAGVLSLGTQVNCVRGSPPALGLVRFGEDGALDQSFGSAGQVTPPSYSEAPVLARDRLGRPLLLAFRGELQMGPLLLRLRRNGSPDERFGKGDGVELPLEGRSGALASDHRSRPIFASGEGDRVLGWRLVVGRRQRNGAIDRSFGRKGEVATRFPGEVQARQILVGGSGKILVGGTLIEGRNDGIALARYLGR